MTPPPADTRCCEVAEDPFLHGGTHTCCKHCEGNSHTVHSPSPAQELARSPQKKRLDDAMNVILDNQELASRPPLVASPAQDWRGTIEKILWKHYDPDMETMNAEEIMDDIVPVVTALLTRERESLAEKVEGLRKKPYGQFPTIKERNWNDALEAVLSIITKHE